MGIKMSFSRPSREVEGGRSAAGKTKILQHVRFPSCDETTEPSRGKSNREREGTHQPLSTHSVDQVDAELGHLPTCPETGKN